MEKQRKVWNLKMQFDISVTHLKTGSKKQILNLQSMKKNRAIICKVENSRRKQSKHLQKYEKNMYAGACFFFLKK